MLTARRGLTRGTTTTTRGGRQPSGREGGERHGEALQDPEHGGVVRLAPGDEAGRRGERGDARVPAGRGRGLQPGRRARALPGEGERSAGRDRLALAVRRAVGDGAAGREA